MCWHHYGEFEREGLEISRQESTRVMGERMAETYGTEAAPVEARQTVGVRRA